MNNATTTPRRPRPPACSPARSPSSPAPAAASAPPRPGCSPGRAPRVRARGPRRRPSCKAVDRGDPGRGRHRRPRGLRPGRRGERPGRRRPRRGAARPARRRLQQRRGVHAARPDGPGRRRPTSTSVYAVNLKGAWLAMTAEIAADPGHRRDRGDRQQLQRRQPAGQPRAARVRRDEAGGQQPHRDSAAVTYGPEGIRVNAIAPGGTADRDDRRVGGATRPGSSSGSTAHTPLGRPGRPRRDRRGRRVAAQRPCLLRDRHGRCRSTAAAGLTG